MGEKIGECKLGGEAVPYLQLRTLLALPGAHGCKYAKGRILNSRLVLEGIVTPLRGMGGLIRGADRISSPLGVGPNAACCPLVDPGRKSSNNGC